MAGIGDFFSRWLIRFFGSANDRQLATVLTALERINALEPAVRRKTDAELRQTTPDLRQKLANGASLDDVLPDAFAATREAARRALGMRHYDVQMIGGMVLHRGGIAEMVTGEGKTLVATSAAVLNGMTGKGVHVVTVNDYLAKRDRDWMAPVYEALGLTVGVIQHDMDNASRQRAYGCDLTYGTNNEFGFDYLRDNMKTSLGEQVLRGHHFAIVDEVDSILIDEARTPLIIAGPSDEATEKYYQADRVIRGLTAKPADLPPDAEGAWHFLLKEKEHQCILTEAGLAECERRLGLDNIYADTQTDWPHHLTQALKAHHLYKRDHHYVAMNGEIIIVDEFTGRLMPGRRWSDGQHQAVEAKEGLRIQAENQTLATITLQNYFKLYGKLAGMTGTAKTEEHEFDKIYKLGVVQIPTNRPLIRSASPDVVYLSEREKFSAIIEEIVRLHATGRPMLVGTVSIEKSEVVSEMLKQRGVPHQVLNAKHHEREAFIISKAGQLGAVTIATNMAGRGTDIILGTFTEAQLLAHWQEYGLAPKAVRLGQPAAEIESALVRHWVEHFLVPLVDDKKAEKRAAEETRLRGLDPVAGRAALETHWTATHHPRLRLCTAVAALGGLHVVGTERHESRRIDNQLRGRAGRQGDPGSSQYFLSLEDRLMRLFAGPKVQALLRSLGMREGDDITSPMVTRRIEAAQKKVEIHNFEARKNLLEYDEVMNEQRKTIYGMRQAILEIPDQRARVLEMIDDSVRAAATRFMNPALDPEDRDAGALSAWLKERTGLDVAREEIQAAPLTAVGAQLAARAQQAYVARMQTIGEAARTTVDKRIAYALEAVADGVGIFTDPQSPEAARSPEGFAGWFTRRTGAPLEVAELKTLAADPIRLRETLLERAKANAGRHEREAAAEFVPRLETTILLDIIDAKWKDHLLAMDHLRDSIGLRGYAQVDPKVEYKREGYQMFGEALDSIRGDVMARLFHIEPPPDEALPPRPSPRLIPPTSPAPPGIARDVREAKREAARGVPPPPPAAAASGGTKRLGRNDPCFCGSGQKFKKCHGKTEGDAGDDTTARPAPAAAGGVGNGGATPPAGAGTDAFGAIPKVGRNQPCPCGSGKKYKQCHGEE